MSEQPGAEPQPAEPQPAEPQPEAPSQPHPEARRGSAGTAWLGAVLIGLGLVFLIGQLFDVDWAAATWPFYVIAPGVGMLAFGLTQRQGSGLAVAGSIVTMVGLVLLYQNATDHWESWAYAWALVGPGGSGLGMLLYGTRTANRRMARDGFWQVLTAIGLFLAGFVFFEGIIGISGRQLPIPNWVLPAAVIAIGVIVLLRGITSRGAGGDEAAASSAAPPPDGAT